MHSAVCIFVHTHIYALDECDICVRRVLRNVPFGVCNCVSAFLLSSVPVCMWLFVSAALRSSVTCMLTGK